MHEKRIHDIALHTDSLTSENVELNKRLTNLIVILDRQTKLVLQNREQKIIGMQYTSFKWIIGVFIFTVLLLLGSYIFICRDLQQKRMGRKKLEEMNRQNRTLLEMRKNIILTVSHDIRGPLGNILNSTELAMDTREKKRRNIHLEHILLSCRHILHLVNDLMDLYRINEAKDTKNEVPFWLDGLLGRIAEAYTLKANNKGLFFHTDYKKTEVQVVGDTDRIEQVLDNLLSNAVKFTKTGGISFTAYYNDSRLSLEIRDTGIGMDKETVTRVFLPFERAAQEINIDGFGLGLPITQGLVKVLGGSMTVESVVREGSVFKITLPLLPVSENTVSEKRAIYQPISLPGKVLVIDDDPILLKIVHEMLERSGFFCTACPNVKEMVPKLRESEYDLILTDIQMPDCSGINLLELLRTSHIGNSKTVPIVAMTARCEGNVEAFLRAGFSGCIHKPFSKKELLSFISSFVKKNDDISPLPDFSVLTEEVEDKQEILWIFVRESRREVKGLEEALLTMDRELMIKTMHRMLPVWSLLQTEEILYKYRSALHDEGSSNETLEKHTRHIISFTEQLIGRAENEIKRIAYEENTDS